MSFGMLSKWFKSLNKASVKKKIAKMYGIHHEVLESWLHHLSVVRNICAHHSRLWNRDFERIKPAIPDKGADTLRDELVEDHGLHNTLVIIGFLLNTICPKNAWRKRVNTLVEQHSNISVVYAEFKTLLQHKKEIVA